MASEDKDTKITLTDGAFYSRKFLLTLVGLALVTVIGVVGLDSINVTAIFPTFIGGVLGILSLYFTGNVVAKHLMGKHIVSMQQQTTISSSEEESEDEEIEGK